MLLGGVDVKKGKYGDAATGDIAQGCDVSLVVAVIDETEIVDVVCTPATSSCNNNGNFLAPSADIWYSWQSGIDELARL